MAKKYRFEVTANDKITRTDNENKALKQIQSLQAANVASFSLTDNQKGFITKWWKEPEQKNYRCQNAKL